MKRLNEDVLTVAFLVLVGFLWAVLGSAWYWGLLVLAIGALLAALAWASVESIIRGLGAIRLLIVIAAYVVTALMVGDSEARLGFYEAAAQVIPVLLLALVLESRLLGVIRDKAELIVGVLILVGLAAAEGEALSVLADGDAAGGDLNFVAGAMAAGFAGVLVAPFGYQLVVLRDATTEPSEESSSTTDHE